MSFLVVILLLEMVFPYLTQGAFQQTVSAADPYEDGTIYGGPGNMFVGDLATVSPSLKGSTRWTFDGMTEIVGNGSRVGWAYRYKSGSQYFHSVNPGSLQEWAEKGFMMNNNPFGNAYSQGVIRDYNFAPDAVGGVSRDQFKRIDFIDLVTYANATYSISSDNKKITFTASKMNPKISKFEITNSKMANGCYAVGEKLNIKVVVENINTAKLKKLEAFIYNTANGATPIHLENGIVENVTPSNKRYEHTFTYTPTTFTQTGTYIRFLVRAVDEANNFDQDTETNGEDFGQIGKVGLKLDICTAYKQNDNRWETIPFYANTSNGIGDTSTYFLIPSLFGSTIGRATRAMRTYPDGNSLFFGPVRYPTVLRGHVDDGGTYVTGVNTTFNVPETAAYNDKNILAYRDMGFLQFSGKIDPYYFNPAAGRPMIANSGSNSNSFNVQRKDLLTPENIKKAFGGNIEYIMANLPSYTFRAQDGTNYGEFYYIRDIAEAAGADVGNKDTSSSGAHVNDTYLQIYQTLYPDIRKFALKDDKTNLAVGSKAEFTFNGWEYTSPYQARNGGADRDKVKYEVTLTGPGGKTISVTKGEGTVRSTKKLDSKEPTMAKYSGEFKNPLLALPTSASLTEKGAYTATLTVYDEVERDDVAELKFTVGCAEGDKDPSCSDFPEGEKPNPPGTGSGGACSITMSITNSGSNAMTGNNMTADPTGVIKSSSESAEFDVQRYGIPSSEYLHVSGESEKYISQFGYDHPTVKVTYKIDVTRKYILEWEEESTADVAEGEEPPPPEKKTEEQEVTKPVEDTYEVSYWTINNLKVLAYSDVTVENYALPGELVNILAGFTVTGSVDHNKDINSHVFPVNCEAIDAGEQTISGGNQKPAVPDEDFKQWAKIGSRTPNVKNDSLTLEGTTYMNGATTSKNGPTPMAISKAPRVVIERGSYQISPQKINKRQTRSVITANYKPVSNLVVNTSATDTRFTNYSPSKINTVTVHTPTVIYPKATDDKEHDQRADAPDRSNPANPDTDRHAFVLDRPFTVTLSTQGQHLSTATAPGYGNRDYGKAAGESCNYNGTACKAYTKDKQVRFPFDVYSETKQKFYPANTWISVPLDIDDVTFYLPVWVPEGQYTVEFRSFAINSPSFSTISEAAQTERPEANLGNEFQTPDGNIDHHIAYDTLAVDVVGRVYDLQVTDITDYNWQSVFRNTDGITHSGNSYYVGDAGIDGDKRGNTEPFVLPIRQGSHPDGYDNVAVKTGYSFSFNLKTKGNMFGATDAIRIKPKFYFVSKDGTQRQKIDVYYHDDTNYFVKIGSDQDKIYREIKLNTTTRNVPETEILANADYYYRHADDYGFKEEAANNYATSFARQYVKHMSKEDIPTGPYGWQILNYKLRTFMGPEENEVPANTMVPANEIVAREQTWYGEYSLPANVYPVPKGTDISAIGLAGGVNENHPIFLRDGYIIVNFDIETIRDGNLNAPYLQYINAKLSNQWSDWEGFQHSFVDPYGHTFNSLDGDVLYYHADASSSDDFSASVTH